MPAALSGAVLGGITSVVAVVAHPDDESFGLGALISSMSERGVSVAVLCFTHGEASTLGDEPGDLAVIRAGELRKAATVLGVGRVELLDYPDGGLSAVEVGELSAHVTALIGEWRPSHLLVFDAGGLTGHPDHVRATEAALVAARAAGLPVLAWALPQEAAERLNAEFGAEFVGRAAGTLDQAVVVSRVVQERAIECHRSQSADNPVLRRRLELLGEIEYLRVLHHPNRIG